LIEIFLDPSAAAEVPKKRRKATTTRKLDTVSIKFRDQLSELISILSETEAHYVRCVKPNSFKEPNNFNSYLVLDQLRYAGILSVIQIRKAGFPVRRTFAEFYHRYKILRQREDVESSAPKEEELTPKCLTFVNSLLQWNILEVGQYQFGKTKLFLKEKQYYNLEYLREAKLHNIVSMIQRLFKSWLYKTKYLSLKKASIVLQSAIRAKKATHIFLNLK